MKKKTAFTTVITCMDGRIQLPVLEWIAKHYGKTYPDTITEPGPVKILSENQPNEIIKNIKKRLDISMRLHGSKRIFLVAHDDCAGNPVSREKQWAQMKIAVENVNQWKPEAEIIPLWVDLNGKVSKLDLN